MNAYVYTSSPSNSTPQKLIPISNNVLPETYENRAKINYRRRKSNARGEQQKILMFFSLIIVIKKQKQWGPYIHDIHDDLSTHAIATKAKSCPHFYATLPRAERFLPSLRERAERKIENNRGAPSPRYSVFFFYAPLRSACFCAIIYAFEIESCKKLSLEVLASAFSE